MIGQTIGNFEIVARIGRGGMGEVFLAQQRSIETKVAIKVLQPEVSKDKNHVKRFFNEARAVGRIKHAGITKIFDVGFHEPTGHAYLIMEYLEGETLGERLARIKRLPLVKLADIGRQIASVLDATHAVGIIHRDLKPDNIFLVADSELPSGERVKVLDFGIAKLTDTVNGPRTVGTMGTPTYMAPEQWGDSAHVDWRADLYSLGCVIYEMATGVPPFDATSIAELYAQHLTMAPPSLRAVMPEMPPTLDQLALRMLAKNPAARVDSMREVIKCFDSLTSSSPFVTTMPGQRPLVGAADAPGGVALQPKHDGDTTPDHDTRNTTLSRMSSQIAGRRPTSERLLPVVLVSAITVVLAMIVVVAVKKKREHPQPIAETIAPALSSVEAVPADALIVPDAAAPQMFTDWIAIANPFVTLHGIATMSHQVTRGEYRRYLAELPSSNNEAPLYRWDDSAPDAPVAWLPQDRAARFCTSIHARLPTSDQWTKLAAGAWGIDPTGKGKLGPLEEWTSTVTDGLVAIRGATAQMPPQERDTFDASPHSKLVDTGVGKRPPANVIAEQTIGFRCVR